MRSCAGNGVDELGDGESWLGDGGVGAGVDGDGLHAGEVDDEGIVADAGAEHAVARSADGERNILRLREEDKLGDLRGGLRLCDKGGAAVDAAFQTARSRS